MEIKDVKRIVKMGAIWLNSLCKRRLDVGDHSKKKDRYKLFNLPKTYKYVTKTNTIIDFREKILPNELKVPRWGCTTPKEC